MDRAMDFYKRPVEERERQVARIMRESVKRFNHDVCAKAYIDIYEKMLHRPLVRSFDRDGGGSEKEATYER